MEITEKKPGNLIGKNLREGVKQGPAREENIISLYTSRMN